MTNFRTLVSAGLSPHKMVISDKIFTIGSCFADTIGKNLSQNKMRVMSNPFGILYNPHSIFKALRYATSGQLPPDHTFLKQQDIFLNYDFHSEISAMELDILTSNLRENIQTSGQFLRQAQWMFITFGTAWVYARKDTGEMVANCHKIPQTQFSRSLLTQQQIRDTFDSFYLEIKKINPTLKIVLTVSPVRHIKESLEGNSVSKSVLRTACFVLCEEYDDVEYFPAYEIMMDDLRDYRFYSADMIHPTTEAEDYIWEKFGERYFDPSLRAFIAEWKQIRMALAHKPFHPTSEAHQRFLSQLRQRLEAVRETVNIDQELAQLQAGHSQEKTKSEKNRK